MRKIKEIGIPFLIWAFFLGYGILFAINFAKQPVRPPDPMPIMVQALCCLVGFTFGFLVSAVNLIRRKSTVDVFAEIILIAESYRIIEKRASPFLVGAAFFGIVGGLGGILSFINHMPPINRQILYTPISAAIGLLLGWFLFRNKSWRMRDYKESALEN